MTGPPGRADVAPDAAAAAGLHLVLTCPQCGAPEAVDADAVSFSCGHCASFLVVAHPGREPAFTSALTVPAPRDVQDVVILYRVQAYRAEVVARYGQEEPDGTRRPPAEDFILRQMEKYEERLRRELRLEQAFLVHVPYWHITGSVLQAILGREKGGPKEVRLRAFAVEHTVPAYDEARLNLRDRGLRMAGSRLQPLTRARVAEMGPSFVPWRPVQERSYLEIRKWLGRDLDPTIEPVTKQGAFVFARRYLVYRPYWLARVVAAEAPGWVLVDGTFGTLAGHPEPAEVQSLRKAGGVPPDGGEEGEIRAVVRPSRCPDCGAEQRLDRHAHLSVCGNCHLLLETTGQGLRVVPHDHAAWGAPDLDATWLPFWAYPFGITPAGAARIARLEDYARALFPQGLPPGFAMRGERLFVPAFRLLGTETGDRVFDALVERVHAEPPEVWEGKLPVGGSPTFHPVTVPEPDAREAVRFALWALHGRASAARLNTMLVKRMIEQAALALGPGRLVLLPFASGVDSLRLLPGDVEVPRALAVPGPEIEALRATVYQPRPRK